MDRPLQAQSENMARTGGYELKGVIKGKCLTFNIKKDKKIFNLYNNAP